MLSNCIYFHRINCYYPPIMNIIGQLLEIAGSLGLFLFGMKIMSEGIQKAAGSKMKAILRFMTGNRFAAVFTGLAITAIVQSSSATTVMIVSFVNAGLMNLTQSIQPPKNRRQT